MTKIDAILTGRVRSFTDDGKTSAIAKTPVDRSRAVEFLGIEGDQQADLTVHGGRDKAIHHYPRDHYEWWTQQLGANALLERVGAFGENVSTCGLTEKDVCIGDRFRLGSALVEVCQGRQPCWKQAHRLSDKRVVGMMVTSSRAGWYYRVLEEGSVAPGDALVPVERPHPEWTVARTTALVIAGVGRDTASVRALRQVTRLAEGWRGRLARL